MDIPSSWLAGLALGMVMAATLGLGALDRGQAVPWARLLAVLLLGVGVVPAVEFFARAGFAALTAIGGAMLEWRERNAALQPPPDEDQPEPQNDDAARLHGWKVAMLRAVMYADLYDWPFEILGPKGVSVMDRGDWDRVTDHLRDCAILHKREKSRTRYQPDWDVARVRDQIRLGLPLPYPAGAAPVVHSPRCTDAQEAVIAQETQKRKATREPADSSEAGPAARRTVEGSVTR